MSSGDAHSDGVQGRDREKVHEAIISVRTRVEPDYCTSPANERCCAGSAVKVTKALITEPGSLVSTSAASRTGGHAHHVASRRLYGIGSHGPRRSSP